MDIFNSSSTSDSNHLLKALFNNAVDGILLIDERGIVEAVNPSAAEMFGYVPEEIVGNNIKMLMPQPYHGEHDGYLKNYRETGIKKIIGIGRKVEGKRKNGEVFPFSLSVSEVENSGKRLFAGIVHDISEIQIANKALESSRNRLKAIINTAVDTIIIINSKGIIADVNPATSQLFQYRIDEMMGQNIKMLMPNPHHDAHDGYLSNYHRTQNPKIIGIGREVEGKKKDGTIFPLRLGVSEFLVDGEKFFAGIIHDLTARKVAESKIQKLNLELERKVISRTEELANVVNQLLSTNKLLKAEVQERKEIELQLKKSKEELEKLLEKEKELGELKSRFVSTASHEFRTPLSTILSSVSLIGKYLTEEQQPRREKHINRIKASVEHLNGILNDFLSISKLEEGRVEYQPHHFEWKPFLNEVLDSIRVILKKGQHLTVSAQSIEKDLFLDDKLLKNILFNLLSNSSKYSKEDQEIKLDTKIEKGILKITIQDFGMGIPHEEQPRLFTRFYRAKNAANIKGTGLGLNIVKRYLDLMNGTVSFKSELHEGTTFYIKIPIA